MKLTQLASLVILLGLSFGYARAEADFSKSEPKKTLSVGGLFALSGPLTSFSQDIQRGIQLAAEDIQESQGLKINIYPQDTKMEATPSLTAFEYLRTVKDIRHFFVLGSSGLLAIKPLLKTRHALIMTSASHEGILEGDDTIIQHTNDSTNDATVLADYVNELIEPEKAVVFTLENPWAIGYSAILEKKLSDFGINVRNEEYFSEEQRFQTLLLKAKSKNPDVIIISAFGPSLIEILKQYKALGITIPIVANIGFAITENKDDALKLGLQSFHYQDMPLIPEKFSQSFNKSYGSYPNGYWAVTAYTDLELLAYAVQEVGQEPLEVSKFIKQTPTFKGKYETIQVSENGNVIVPTVMKKASLPQ